MTQQEQRELAALQRGYQRIRQGMANGTLPPDLQTATNELHRQDQQSRATAELLAFAQRLPPQQLEHLARLDRDFGGTAMFNVLITSSGLSREALEVAAATYEQAGSFGGLVGAVQERLQAVAQEQQQTNMQASADKWAPKEGDAQAVAQVKHNSPYSDMLRNPELQALAAPIVQKAGIAVRQGQSPLEALFVFTRQLDGGNFVNESTMRITGNKFERAKMEPSEAIAMLAQAMGESPKDMAAFLAEVDNADRGHDLAHRLAVHDKPMIQVKPEAARRVRAEDGRRKALEEAFTRLETPAPRERATVARAQPAKQERPAPELRHEALSRAWDRIDREEEATPAEQANDGRHAALSDAYDDLSEEEAVA